MLQNPMRLTFQGQKITYARVNEKIICVIVENGSLYCWGDGFLGYGSREQKSKPDSKPINFQGKRVKQVLPSQIVSCAILEDESLHCWGMGNLNGYSDGLSRYVPDSKPINFQGKKVKHIAVQSWGHCALLENHKVYCWGPAPLGYGDQKIRIAPTQESLDFQGQAVSSIALGGLHGCAIIQDGDL
ncbi:MAG: hypothetical protein AAGJ35_07425, partial [Myxococcota bacterium]